MKEEQEFNSWASISNERKRGDLSVGENRSSWRAAATTEADWQARLQWPERLEGGGWRALHSLCRETHSHFTLQEGIRTLLVVGSLCTNLHSRRLLECLFRTSMALRPRCFHYSREAKEKGINMVNLRQDPCLTELEGRPTAFVFPCYLICWLKKAWRQIFRMLMQSSLLTVGSWNKMQPKDSTPGFSWVMGNRAHYTAKLSWVIFGPHNNHLLSISVCDLTFLWLTGKSFGKCEQTSKLRMLSGNIQGLQQRFPDSFHMSSTVSVEQGV